MKQVATGKWQIEQKDVGKPLLLKDLTEIQVGKAHVGKVYVSHPKGDYLEDPPLKDEFAGEYDE